MILNCLVIDDEPLARAYIEGFIARIPFLKLAASARNAQIARSILNAEAIDLVFLDIKMPNQSGLEFLKQNDIFQQVIIISAYPEFAPDGFELEVTDYLVKPVTFERFLKAAEKAFSKIDGHEAIKTLKHHPEFLYVKNNQRYQKIWLDDILYLEAMLNYIHVITVNGKYTIYSSLKNALSVLPKDKFIKVHKSFVVAMSQICSIGINDVVVGAYRIPLSRSNRDFILQAALNSGLKLTISKGGESSAVINQEPANPDFDQ